VLLDERHLHALLVEEQLRPEHFYRSNTGGVRRDARALQGDSKTIT